MGSSIENNRDETEISASMLGYTGVVKHSIMKQGKKQRLHNTHSEYQRKVRDCMIPSSLFWSQVNQSSFKTIATYLLKQLNNLQCLLVVTETTLC